MKRLMQCLPWIKGKYYYGVWAVFLAASPSLFAIDSTGSGIIPISSNEHTGNNSDFITTIIKIFANKVVPVIMILGALWIIWAALSGLFAGYKDAQKEKDLGPLKQAVIKAGIIIVVGGAILYLLTLVTTYANAHDGGGS